MRTLLTDPFPPQFANDHAFSPHAEPSPRTFSEAAVLASVDDLLEVGVDGTATAAPGASAAEETAGTLDRGVAISAQKAFGPKGACSSAFRANAACKESPEDALTS
jgi:hypothetical protein